MADRRDVFTLCAALVVSLLVGEIAVRLLLEPPGLWRFPAADYGVMAPDSLLGYAYAPNLRRHIATRDYEVEFSTNAQGMRDAPLDSGPPPRLRVLAVGDSYTQGLGVEGREAWPKRLEARLPGSRVYNTGVSGYSLHQIRLSAERFLPVVRPHVVLLGLFGHAYYRITNPFIYVSGSASPIARDMSDQVRVVSGGVLLPEFESPALRDMAFWIDEHWYLGGHALHVLAQAWHAARTGGSAPSVGVNELDREALRSAMTPMLDELRLLQRDADSAHVAFAALLLNRQEESGVFGPEQRAYNEVISEFARHERICVVDPLAALDSTAAGRPVLRFAHDVHWTPLAHDVAAAELIRALPKSGEACRRAAMLLAI